MDSWLYIFSQTLLDIPKIATSGGLMIGVKYFPPIPPRLEIVKVPPERSFGLSALDLALSLISASSIDKSSWKYGMQGA